VTVYKVAALEREATKDAWEFEFDGERYRLPPDFDMRAAVAMSSGDMEGGLRHLLGPDQWDRLVASPKVFGLKALTNMMKAYCADIGVDLGEFVASPRSSARTATPSKRTSNGSTGSRSRTSSPPRSD